MGDSLFVSRTRSIMAELSSIGEQGEVILFALDQVIANRANEVPKDIYQTLEQLRLVQSNGTVHEAVRRMAQVLRENPNSPAGRRGFGDASPQAVPS